MIERGKLIAFEGPDGAGKGTQHYMAIDHILGKSKYNDIYVTREPTKFAKEIRERLAGESEVSKDVAWYLNAFVQDRKRHCKLIETMLAQGTHTMSDRFDLSTFFYQHLQGIPIADIKIAHEGLLVPDLDLVYLCDPSESFRRRAADGAESSFDKDLEFQKKLAGLYEEAPKIFPERNIVIVDGSKSIKAVHEDTKKELDKIF